MLSPLSFILISCLPKKQGPEKLKVCCSVPALYDWTRNLADESTNTSIYIKLLVKNGLYYHNYIPSDKDKEDVLGADLLIYIGGPSEKWIDDILSQESQADTHPDRLLLRLMDFVESQDEHFILSPRDAIICCNKIEEKLCELEPEKTESLGKSTAAYIAQLNLLDMSYKQLAKKMQGKPFIICDRFPFRYLFEQYGLEYISAFPDCPAGEQAAFTKSYLGAKIDEFKINAVYIMENSDNKFSNSVIAYSKNPKCDTFMLDSLESATLSSLFDGDVYISAARSNLEKLQKN